MISCRAQGAWTSCNDHRNKNKEWVIIMVINYLPLYFIEGEQNDYRETYCLNIM
jgi:hypothetical protein